MRKTLPGLFVLLLALTVALSASACRRTSRAESGSATAAAAARDSGGETPAAKAGAGDSGAAPATAPSNGGAAAKKAKKAKESSSGEKSVALDKPGLPNAYRVTKNLYRGAQPTAKGMQELEALGVKTVINLRSLHSDSDEIGSTKLRSVNIPMHAWHAEDEDVIKFLKVVSDEKNGPFFVHCEFGSDRTGLLVAVYRIVHCGWTKDRAIREMTKGPYGYHEFFDGLVHYLRDLDVEKIEKKANIEKEAAPAKKTRSP